ncbi:MAG: RNA methyltransferase [Spirochaetales bacterium]|nr:RNA methyltransferase [Spirochaetales bacterium]
MESQNNLERVAIVLVDPQEGANVGSVCRAMKTMGLSRLVIVGEKEYSEERVKSLAVHASDIWENHRRYPTLQEAVKESVLVVGSTRRRGKKRKYFSLTPEQLAERISLTGEGEVSIVFGRESDGLTDAELALCHAGVKIPTSDNFPSLNLSQAVQIIAYTLFKELTPLTTFTPIKEERLNHVIETIAEAFEVIKFYKQDERKEVESFFHDILGRSTLSEKEAQRLEKIFIKMSRIKVHKQNDETKD